MTVPIEPSDASNGLTSGWVDLRRRAGVRLGAAGEWVLFALTRLARIDTTFEEAKARKYGSTAQLPTHPVDKEQAEFLFKLEREDSDHTDQKVKQLLTLSSSLATFVLVFARDVRPWWLIVVLLGLLVITVFLCLSVLAVRAVHLPLVSDASIANSEHAWSEGLIAAMSGNRNAHRFRVDRYRAAARYFKLALFLTPIAALLTLKGSEPISPLERSADAMVKSLDSLRLSVDELQLRVGAIRMDRPSTSAGSSGQGVPDTVAAARADGNSSP